MSHTFVACSVGKVHFLRELVQSSVHKFLNEALQLNVHDSNFLTKFTLPKNELVHSSFFQYLAVSYYFFLVF